MKKLNLILFTTTLLLLFNCKKSKEDKVHVHCDNLVNEKPANDPGIIFVANYFTPNGDGLNDLFRPKAFNVSSTSIKVYDKNSTLVFESTQLNAGWSAGVSAQGNIYYYRVEAVTNMGSKIGVCGEAHAISCYKKASTSPALTFEDQITPNGFTGVSNESIINCN